MDRPTVYIETTIVSDLAARPSRDLTVASHQRLTRDWWDGHRGRYDLMTSQFVHDEAGLGDPAFAAARLELLRDVIRLEVTPEAARLARSLISHGPLPAQAEIDAAHIATAAIHGVDYLLTWNCKHIANPAMLRALTRVCSAAGYQLPVPCTPEQLLAEA